MSINRFFKGITREQVSQFYTWGLVVVLVLAYSSPVWAQMNIDETNGPFMQIFCPMLRWMINLVLPIAAIAFAVAGSTYLWGAELTEMTKKWIYGICAVVFIFAGIASLIWIARKFGFNVASSCFQY